MTWGVSDLLARRPSLSRLAAAAAVIVLGVLGWLTYVQAGFWHDDFTLFKHAIAVTGPNRVIHHNLAMAYSRIQDYGAAEEQFREAISARPTADDYSGLGAVLLVEGRPQEAAEACETAVQHAPNLAMAHQNLGAAYAQLGRPDLASDEFIRAIELDPRQAKAHLGLARVLAESNRLDEAIEHFEAAVRVEPGNVPAWLGLAACLVRVGRVDEATQQLRLAVDHNPSNSDLANALSSLESGIVGGGR